ncbi:MAG TPA: AMP-dependent synthetase/ligase [Myxococcota bacterium]|nr:AMP-dependent synthetase/ligase [Myxococcota bacterium]
MSKRDICIDRLRQRALHHKDENVYFSQVNEKWEPITWHEYHEQVRQFAKSLLHLGFKADSKVAVLGFNQLEWAISAIGAQYAGGVSVGVYTASSKEEVSYVVDHSDAEVLVVENLARYQSQVHPIRAQLPKIKLVVLMSNENCHEAGVVGFSTFMSMGRDITDHELDERQRSIAPSSVATMIYTSGTTGNPKSVMLSHATLAWTVRTAVQSWRCGPWDKAVSYLPLAHVAEQMFTLYAPLDSGMQSYFAPSFDALKETIKDVEPTVFFGVPRIYEKMYEAVRDGLSERGYWQKKLVSYFSRVTSDYYKARHTGRMPSLWTNSQYQFGSKKIFSELKKKMGFGNARICVCGAAPISKDILTFFNGLDIPIYEIFGQSENAGPASFNLPGQAKIGTVGRAMPGSEIKIADDGEILIKGPHVFLGYYKDEAATAEVLKHGWLATGDIGAIDKDGFLRITDRKKDLLITAGGKNISPQNLEAMLKTLPYVQSAVVVGDAKKYLCALLSPDVPSIQKKASLLGKPAEPAHHLITDEAIQQEISAELDRINSRLAPVEQIKKFALLPNEFSVDSGEFTPTMKVKRKFVNQKYQREIEKMYQ